MDVYAAEVLPRSIEALAGEKVPVRVLNANIFVVVNVVVVVVGIVKNRSKTAISIVISWTNSRLAFYRPQLFRRP